MERSNTGVTEDPDENGDATPAPPPGRARRRRSVSVLAVVAWLALAATAAASPAHIRYARLTHSCARPSGSRAACFAIARRPVSAASAASPGVEAFTAGAYATGAGPAGGYTPAQLAKAYGYDRTGGTGQTVAVVDAYDDPNIEADLKAFDEHYGLGECTKASGCFKKVNQTGSEEAKALPAADSKGWSTETSLDVQAVRAACEGCKILLVEAKSASYEDLSAAVEEAVPLGATEVSNSYGGPEEGMPAELRARYKHPGVVITAAAGDFGWGDWNDVLAGYEPPAMADVPASLQSVVAVGGTALHLHEDGTRSSESVWNDYGVAYANKLGPGYASGGGCSTLFSAGLWQSKAAGYGSAACGGNRLVADVAADADPVTGFDIYDTFDYCGSKCPKLEKVFEAGWQTFGGTSLSSPLIASLYALAGGADGLSAPAVMLYGHLGGSSLYDVTQGGNGFCDGEAPGPCGEPEINERFGPLDCEGTSSCDARAGFDGPSGVGAPNGIEAFKPLFPTAVITPPAKLVEGTGAGFGSSGSHDPYPGGSITAWSWTFGDGSPVNHSAAPLHTYAAAGEYEVGLTVTDNYGLTSTKVEQPVHVITIAEAKHEEEEEAKKKEEEANKHEEEAAKERHEEEAAAKRKHEEEEAAALKRKLEEEAAAKRKLEEEARSPGGSLGVAGFSSTAPGSLAPAARLASTTLTVSTAGVLKVQVSCPAGASGCAGSLALRTLQAVLAGAHPASRPRPAVLTLTAGSFRLGGGTTGSLTLHLSSKGRSYFGHHHPLRAVMTITAHDLAGLSSVTHQTVTLKPAPAVHRRH